MIEASDLHPTFRRFAPPRGESGPEPRRIVEEGEYKYLVNGASEQGQPIEVACKIGPTEKAVIITVYAV